MSVLAALNLVSITTPEESTVAGQLASNAGYGGIAFGDAAGIVSSALASLSKIKADLTVAS